MEIKTLNEIYDEMRLDFVRRTGVSAGDECDLAARMYALAAQIYALQVQGEWVKRQSFPQTAQGEYLDRHAEMRGLKRKPAACAEGVVRFTMGQSAPYIRAIPAGTVVMTEDQMRFETKRQGLVRAGEMWGDVPVKALEAGVAGNVPAGAITCMAVAPVGVVSCTNPEGLSGGAEQEEDEALRERVLESCRLLPNGGNAAYYRQLLLSDSEVAKVVVVPRPRGVGSVDLVVSTWQGGLSAVTMLRLQTMLDKEREIAVDAQVRAPTSRRYPIKVQVKAREGYDPQQVFDRVEAAIRGLFTGELMGVSVPLVRLGSVIYGCEGVENYCIVTPTSDIVVEEMVQPEIDSLTVEEMV